MNNEEAAEHLRLILDEGLAGDANYDDKGKDAEAVRLAIAALRSPAPGAAAIRERLVLVAFEAMARGNNSRQPHVIRHDAELIADEHLKRNPLPAPEVPDGAVDESHDRTRLLAFLRFVAAHDWRNEGRFDEGQLERIVDLYIREVA